MLKRIRAMLGTTRFGWHKHGNCWKWRPGYKRFSGGNLHWLSFGRAYFVLDLR